MSKINFNLNITIDDCANVIKTIGNSITPIIVSEPGCGKSSILKMLEADLGTDEYDFIYVDCPVKDMMDVAASIPNHASKTLEYYVSSLFKLGNGKKKVIMLDEFMKSPKLLQIIFTRLMLERSVGDEPLPEGSIVFGTSNNASDGVGDSMLAHVGNRVCILHMSKPNAELWNIWATKHKPSSPARSFVSPRSLAKASPIVEAKDIIGEHAMMAALAGTIGEAAAKSMSAFIALEGKLISFADVLKAPSTIKVPDDVSAQVMMMFEAVDVVETQDELNKYMQFVERIPSSEVQSVFFTMIMRGKPRIARYNQAINTWASNNHKLM